jgi:GTP-binding protein
MNCLGKSGGETMLKPVVAIVGRPNVGKSTLFNYIAGRRISIVEDTPGITRDRIYTESEWRGRKFVLIDTGGIEPFTKDEIMQQMRRQAEIAIETADVIVFMVDSKEGLTASDYEVANILRKTEKPVLLVVNKVDQIGDPPPEVFEFYNLGIGEPISISSIHGLAIGDLLDEIYNHFPEDKGVDFDDDIINVAVAGKPNVGKSSLINNILGEERLIVTNMPGTTRDAIDTYVEKGEDKYVFIDTAGIRRKSRITDNIERYSTIRSWTAIERADVCLIMIDAQDGVTEQDTKIAGYAHENGKASIIVVNKWDIIEKTTGTLEKYEKQVLEKLGFMIYAPVVFISALTGQRVERLFDLIKQVSEQSTLRIPTGVLNGVINEATAMVQPPTDKGRNLKIYYVTQVGVKPPKFVIFVNNKELMHYSYERYLENQLRKTFGFVGTPISFIIKERESEVIF